MQLPMSSSPARPIRRTHSATSDQEMAQAPPIIDLLTSGRPLKRCRISDDVDTHMASLSPSPAPSPAPFPAHFSSSPSSPSPSPAPFASASLGTLRDGSRPSSTMSLSLPHTPQSSLLPSLPPHNQHSSPSSRSSTSHDTHKPRSPPQQSHSPPSQQQQQQHTFWYDDGDLVLSVLNSSPDPSLALQKLQQLQAQPEFALAAGNYATPHQLAQAQQAPVYFRVHAARLVAASDAFADLLGVPLPSNPCREASTRAAEEIAARLRQPGDTSVIEIAGCPYIRLDDSPRDWAVALEAIYEQMSFQHRALVFDSLAALLRIATKYAMRPLRIWCVAQLRATWPREITRMAPLALPYAAEAIALARKCDVPEILPAAFYALAIQKWRPSPSSASSVPASALNSSSISSGSFGTGSISGRRSPRLFGPGAGDGIARNGSDGGRAHLVLSPEDLRRVVAGREALNDVLVEIVANPLVIEGVMAEGFEEEHEHDIENLSRREAQQGSEEQGHGQYLISPAPSPSPKTPPSVPLLTDTDSTPMTISLSDAHDLACSTTSVPSSSTKLRPRFSFCFSSPSSASSSSSAHHRQGHHRNRSTCRAGLEALWRAQLAPDPRRAWNVWITRELHKLSTLPYPSSVADWDMEGRASGAWVEGDGDGDCDGDVDCEGDASERDRERERDGSGRERSGSGRRRKVCARCWEENRRLALWRLDWLGDAIAGWFA